MPWHPATVLDPEDRAFGLWSRADLDEAAKARFPKHQHRATTLAQGKRSGIVKWLEFGESYLAISRHFHSSVNTVRLIAEEEGLVPFPSDVA